MSIMVLGILPWMPRTWRIQVMKSSKVFIKYSKAFCKSTSFEANFDLYPFHNQSEIIWLDHRIVLNCWIYILTPNFYFSSEKKMDRIHVNRMPLLIRTPCHIFLVISGEKLLKNHKKKKKNLGILLVQVLQKGKKSL